MPIEPRESYKAEFELRRRDVETASGKVSISYVVCAPLEDAGFLNAFSTRAGGVSPLPSGSLNLAEFNGDTAENVLENRRCFLSAINAERANLITARQTHSTDRYRIESRTQPGNVGPDCDAMTTRLTGVMLGIQTADCLPILIGDTKTKTMAAVHAGWRGTAGRITERTVADLIQGYGVDPRNCIAALGPAACVECYEVGQDVIGLYKKEFGYWRNLIVNVQENGKAHLDITSANVQQLAFCGFSPDRIHVAPYCTMHQNDLFFSYRRENSSRPLGVGRLLSVISLR